MSDWPWPKVFAHRCGGVLAPENTLAGLRTAQQYACRAVEFDVMLNASGTAVVIHDETLDRTTNRRGRVADLSDAALSSVDAGCRFSPAFAGEPLPQFETLALACVQNQVCANVEIKPSCGAERLTGQVVAALAARIWEKTEQGQVPLLSSFSGLVLEEAARHAPSFPRGLLVEAVPGDWQARCARLGVQALHAASDTLDQAMVAALRASGLWVVAYTENDPQRAHCLLAWGVNAVITDRPDLLGALE